MVSKWRKAKSALGCIQLPRTNEDEISSSSAAGVLINNNGEIPRRLSDAANSTTSSAALSVSDCRSSAVTPTPSSSGLRFSRTLSKSSKKTCAICLTSLIPGHGHAIFTAECSHAFHFNCITSNVKHGNHICPVCRAKWKEIPLQGQSSEALRGKLRTNSVNWNRDNQLVAALQQLPVPHPDLNQNVTPTYRIAEPAMFNDDDLIDEQQISREQSANTAYDDSDSSIRRIEIRTFPEVSSVAKSVSYDNFTVLIHMKAPVARISNCGPNSPSRSQSSRAPVDLVTVLDVSGSMAGTKLALVKRAMGFVIQQLGPHDRLSVVVFSSSARRLFHLQRMTDSGRQHALQAVNSLSSNGGTNIAEGLKKGAKVMVERKCKNPVSSIILLSDGQDTYTVNPAGAQSRADYRSLLPNSIQQNSGTSFQIPVHTFGFGADHDSVSMHSIAECSGGTFSFIEAEGVIQDAFAQCMGGLLSVVVQELKLELQCVYPSLQLSSIKAGSYHARLMDDGKTGHISVGDLYAEEERDFLVTMNIPVTSFVTEMPLLKVSCTYRDPITKETATSGEVEVVKINRPDKAENVVVSMEVDKQRNRLKAADAMSEARSAAEHGNLAGAVSILGSCRQTLSESVSAHDALCAGLLNELKEMQERMSSRQVYEESGRAYVLSGLSSHSWQRANARGDTTSSTNLSQSYQTSFMADMITRSQTMVLGSLAPSASPTVRPPRSLSGHPSPR